MCGTRPTRSRCTPRHGVAAVELAIVLPLMLMLAIATVDFGGSVGAYLVLANAARSGADYAATHHFTPVSQAAWESRIHTAVESEMTCFRRYDSTKLQTTIGTVTNADGTIQVSIDVRYAMKTIVPWPGIPAAVPMHYRVEMRQYQ